MVVENSKNRDFLAVSGSTYDFTFKIFDESELRVYGVISADGETIDSATLLTLTTDYTVEISEVSEGGTITTVVEEVATEPSDYDYILMTRHVPFTQAANIPVRGGFNESVIEQALDLIAMQIQQIKDMIDYDEDQDALAVASATASAAAAEVSATAAAASAAAADVSEGAVSDIIVAAIAAANHITTGYDHDGSDSKKVLATNLNMTGITTGHLLYNNGGTLAGQAYVTPNGVQSGQDLAEQTANPGAYPTYATIWTPSLAATVPNIQFFKRAEMTSLYVSWSGQATNFSDNSQKINVGGGAALGAVKVLGNGGTPYDYFALTDTVDISGLTDNAWYTFVIQGTSNGGVATQKAKLVKFAAY